MKRCSDVCEDITLSPKLFGYPSKIDSLGFVSMPERRGLARFQNPCRRLVVFENNGLDRVRREGQRMPLPRSRNDTGTTTANPHSPAAVLRSHCAACHSSCRTEHEAVTVALHTFVLPAFGLQIGVVLHSIALAILDAMRIKPHVPPRRLARSSAGRVQNTRQLAGYRQHVELQ